MAEFPSTFHDGAEHLVVAPPCEKDFPGIQLEKGASYGPDVDSEVVGHAQDDLWSSIEPADEVLGDVVFRCI